MSVTYQEVLEALCSRVALANSNDAQHIFTLNTAREAKLAYDVLAAHGFEVRVYHEPALSKLYIMHSDSADISQRLTSALRFAGMLKQIMQTMPDGDAETFNISFVNTSTQGKQLSIYFPPETPDAAVPAAIRASMPTTAATMTAPPIAKKAVKTKSAVFGAGPALAKSNPFSDKTGTGNTEELTIGKWLSTYVFSNFTQAFYSFITMTFILLVLFSAAIMLKGFLCPDLATVKSRAWYCASRDE